MPAVADLKELIAELNDSGLNDAAITRELAAAGVETTQATINRLKNGVHKSTKFELGSALQELHRRHCSGTAA